MKIGIVGTGNMGRSLGLLWAESGHEVFFGARNLEKAKATADLSNHNTRYGANQAAAEFGEIIYFNPRDTHPQDVLTDTFVLDGKVVIDSNNGPIPDDYAYEPIIVSRSEQLQQQLPDTRVVKAFNTMPQEIFEVAPETLRNYNVACLIAGDDAAARHAVAKLASDIGFEPIDCGLLRQARLIETAGDLIRQIIGTRQDFGATFSILSVPIPETKRLGGRQTSNLA
jgi:hypothetical protein